MEELAPPPLGGGWEGVRIESMQKPPIDPLISVPDSNEDQRYPPLDRRDPVHLGAGLHLPVPQWINFIL
jgi:hypothetical protein